MLPVSTSPAAPTHRMLLIVIIFVILIVIAIVIVIFILLLIKAIISSSATAADLLLSCIANLMTGVLYNKHIFIKLAPDLNNLPSSCAATINI